MIRPNSIYGDFSLTCLGDALPLCVSNFILYLPDFTCKNATSSKCARRSLQQNVGHIYSGTYPYYIVHTEEEKVL